MATKKWFFVLALTVFLSVLVAGTALAQTMEPVGSCPDKWVLHEFMDHEDHMDHHVGLTQDLNGDGYICVYHSTRSGKHVHADNVLPLP